MDLEKEKVPENGTNVPKTNANFPKKGTGVPKTGTKVPENGHKCSPKGAQVSPKTGTNAPKYGHMARDEWCARKRHTMCPKTAHDVPENGTHLCPKRGTTKDKINTTKEKETKESARQRATPAPETFPITDALKTWIQHNHITADLTLETEKFLDYHRAKGSTLKCWSSAWRNWMRRAQDYKPQPKRTPSPTKAPMRKQAEIEQPSALELAQQGLRNHRQLVPDNELKKLLDPKHPQHAFGLQMQADRQAMLANQSHGGLRVILPPKTTANPNHSSVAGRWFLKNCKQRAH